MKGCTNNMHPSVSSCVLRVWVLTLETTAKREFLSPLERPPHCPVAYSRGKEATSTLGVVSAFGPFSADLHCSAQTCTVVIFKHVFLLSLAFPIVKFFHFSLATQKFPFVGTGSPLLCPYPPTPLL